jgi:IS30 family transposase
MVRFEELHEDRQPDELAHDLRAAVGGMQHAVEVEEERAYLDQVVAKRMPDQVRLTIESRVNVLVADHRSSCQRGTKENANGLRRQYFPKGTELSRWSEQDIEDMALGRPDLQQLPAIHHIA